MDGPLARLGAAALAPEAGPLTGDDIHLEIGRVTFRAVEAVIAAGVVGAAVGTDVGRAVGTGVGTGVSHIPLSKQMPLSQSLPNTQILPGPHG